ncbi:hypothetical protein BH20GEM1_BH20GEM1_14590 [soil metagenome]
MVAPAGAAEPRIGVYELHGIPPHSVAADRIDRSFDDPWVAAALTTRSGQAYIWWARVPVAEVERSGGHVTVTLRDLRFSPANFAASETWTPFAIRFRFEERSGTLLEVEW